MTDPTNDAASRRYRTLTISVAADLYDDLVGRAEREGITLREYLRRGVALNRFIGDYRDHQSRRGWGGGGCSMRDELEQRGVALPALEDVR